MLNSVAISAPCPPMEAHLTLCSTHELAFNKAAILQFQRVPYLGDDQSHFSFVFTIDFSSAAFPFLLPA